jgi:hypothetical protein
MMALQHQAETAIPVITGHDAELFVDHRADEAEAKLQGLGELVYAIDGIVAEEIGEPWLRVLVAAYVHTIPAESLAKAASGAGTRLVAFALLAAVAHVTGDGPGMWDYFWRAHALEADSPMRLDDCGNAFRAVLNERARIDAEAAGQ